MELHWRYDRPQALALVEHGLQQSLPVYALFVSRDEVATKQSRLPNVAGYKWHTLTNSDAQYDNPKAYCHRTR